MKELEELSIDHVKDIGQIVAMTETKATEYLERHGYGPVFIPVMMEHRMVAMTKVEAPVVAKVEAPVVEEKEIAAEKPAKKVRKLFK